MTKHYKFKMRICGLLSLLCTFGPLLVFISIGLIQGENKEKIILTLTTCAAIAMAVVSAMRKIHLKSTIYILMIGLWLALDRLLPFIITIAICTILDEIIFTPLYKRFKEDYHTHKQIDKRICE